MIFLVGVFYALVGITFAIPDTHAKAWRLAAWAVSAIAFAAHIAYERLRVRTPPRPAALRAAIAAGIGAFGLAVGANVHALTIESGSRHRLLLLAALVIWPLLTAVPAFVVALALSFLAKSRALP